MQHTGKYHAVSQPVCVMLETLPVHKENCASILSIGFMIHFYCPLLDCKLLPLQRQAQLSPADFMKGQAQIYFHYLIFYFILAYICYVLVWGCHFQYHFIIFNILTVYQISQSQR